MAASNDFSKNHRERSREREHTAGKKAAKDFKMFLGSKKVSAKERCVARHIYGETLRDLSPPNFCGIWIQCARPFDCRTFVLDAYSGDFYDKPLNRWWNGYDHQSCVYVEGWTPAYSDMRCELHLWADWFPFMAPIRHAEGYKIRPKVIVVSSVYSIEECFKDCDEEAIEGLLNRFKVMVVSLPKEDLKFESDVLRVANSFTTTNPCHVSFTCTKCGSIEPVVSTIGNQCGLDNYVPTSAEVTLAKERAIEFAYAQGVEEVNVV